MSDPIFIAGLALKAPVLVAEKWLTFGGGLSPAIKPGITVVVPNAQLPGASFEASGAAWDAINAANDRRRVGK